VATEQADDPGKVSWFARAFFTFVAVGAFVCGIFGFQQYLPSHKEYGSGFLDLVYYSFQLFVLDASPLQNANGLPVLLQVARFAAPAVTVYLLVLATHALIRGRLRQGRIALMRGHSILCGPLELTHLLADQIRSEIGGKVVVIIPEPARPAAHAGELRVTGDPRRRSVLTRAGLGRACELIAVGPDSMRNAEVAIAVHAFNREKGTTVICYAEAQDHELFEAVVRQETGPGGSHVDLFTRHDRTARGLLDSLAPYPPSDPRSAVLMIGYTGLGQTLMDRLMRFWSGVSDADKITPSLCVLDPDVPVAAVKARHADPHGRIAVTARGTDPGWLTSIDDLKVPAADGTMRIPGRVYVCLDDDAAGIAAGNVALRLLAGHDTTVVVAVAHSGVLGGAARRNGAGTRTDDDNGTALLFPARELDKAKLVLVSVLRTVYSITAIRTGTNEALARAIHDTYFENEKKRGETAETNPSAVPWEQLPPYLRDSNREQAWNIGHKLEMIGFSAAPATGAPPQLTIDKQDVETLAKVEHVRWMAERVAKGWRHGQIRDNERKFHPDLVDWRYLSNESQERDRAAVRAIPAYLTAAGLTMVRTKSR